MLKTMSLQHININIPNHIRLEHYMSYINDKLYSTCNVIEMGDTVIVNNITKYTFGYDGKVFIHSDNDHIPIPVGRLLPIDTFNKHDVNLDHVLLDISDGKDKEEMINNLTPFSTIYRGQTIYFVTTNPSLTYHKMLNLIEKMNTILIGYEDGNMLFCDIDHDFNITEDIEIISFDETLGIAELKWNNKIFNIRYSYVMHLCYP